MRRPSPQERLVVDAALIATDRERGIRPHVKRVPPDQQIRVPGVYDGSRDRRPQRHDTGPRCRHTHLRRPLARREKRATQPPPQRQLPA